MPAEFAKNPHRGALHIEDVPAFRQHLRRNGLRNLREWEARNKVPRSAATEADALTLQARYLRVKANA